MENVKIRHATILESDLNKIVKYSKRAKILNMVKMHKS